MAEFVGNRDNYDNILKIIDESQEFLVIVVPYFKLYTMLLDKLRKALERGTKVVFIYRNEKGKKLISLNKELGKLPLQVCIGGLDELHAKIYLNEKTALLTSMNLLDSTSRKNFEWGTLYASGEPMYEEAYTYVRKLMSFIPELRNVSLRRGLFYLPEAGSPSSGRGLFSAPDNNPGLFRLN